MSTGPTPSGDRADVLANDQANDQANVQANVPANDHAVRAYLVAFVMIGIALSTAGPALSHLRDRMHTDDGGIAVVFAGQAVGYIAGSFIAGRGLDRGRGHVWWVSALGVITVTVALADLMPNLPLMVAMFAVMGGACGMSDVCGNTLVMWSRPEGPGSLLNALHLCFAIGALCSPILVNRSLHFTDSIWGVAVPLAIGTVVCAAIMLPHPPPRRTRLDTLERSNAGGSRTTHVVVVCLFFFAYVALESGFAGWIHTYTEQIHYGGSGTATGMITTFWVGFALGRVLAIWLARVITPGWMVASTMGLSIVATVLFAAFRGPGPMLWVVTFAFALSVAPQYASMMAFAESHLALSGGNTAMIVAASGLGGLVLPWALGQLFDAVGPGSLPVAMVGTSLLTAALAAVVGHMLLSGQRPPVTSMKAPVT